MNRKLFRPRLQAVKRQNTGQPIYGMTPPKKATPPERTFAEDFYWIKQMPTYTPMTIMLVDGETVRGVVEWYDHDCIKLRRDEGPTLLIFKHAIRYVCKEKENRTVKQSR